MKRITTCILAAALMVTGVFFALPKESAFASAEVSAPIDVAAEIARAKQEWLDKEAALPHEAIPQDAETHVKDGVTYTVIRDCAGFQAIENNLSGNYIVANDLDMTDFTTPIGWGPCVIQKNHNQTFTEPIPFSGVFDGNNYKMKNIKNFDKIQLNSGDDYLNSHFYGLALFNNSTGCIRNIVIDETCEIDADSLPYFTENSVQRLGDNVAFIVAQNMGIIENIYSHGSIIGGEKSIRAGSICAQMSNLIFGSEKPQYTSIVKNCVNFGNIKITLPQTDIYSYRAFAGGIAAVLDHDRAEMSQLYNFGEIKSSVSGGILAFAPNNSSTKSPVTIFEAINYGKVTANSYGDYPGDAGGVSSRANVKNIQNYGEIYGDACVGGVVGEGTAENSNNFVQVKGGAITGGIVGEGTAKNCMNWGSISGGNETGGIVGRGFSLFDPVVEECVQNGNITGNNYVGGIIGNSINIEVRGNKNYGNIYGKGKNVGAIVGGSNTPETYLPGVGEPALKKPKESNNMNAGFVESDAHNLAARKRRTVLIIGCSIGGVGLVVCCGIIVVKMKKRKI